MGVSIRFKGLYDGMYDHGVAREWRDLGAIDKAANIDTIWHQAKLPPRPKIVEIGSGEGALASALQRLGFFSHYQGFDLSESGITEATARKVPSAEFLLVDGDGIPVEDDSADIVVLSHVVEHLEHPRVLLYEAYRIARHVIVEVPLELNARTPWNYIWDDLGHINKYSATSIRHLIQTCNFVVVQQTTSNPSRAVSLFHDDSMRHRLEWQIKSHMLTLAPRPARALFTYHETLLASAIR